MSKKEEGNKKDAKSYQFQKGNQLWRQRSKYGRDKLFATPELLLEAAQEYFTWVDTHPLEIEDYVGKNAKRVMRQKPRPYSIHGLCTYLGTHEAYFRQFKIGLKESTYIDKEQQSAFSTIVAFIEATIYSQKYEGAAANIFNPSIIARDLGLKEQTTNDVNINKVEQVFEINGQKIKFE